MQKVIDLPMYLSYLQKFNFLVSDKKAGISRTLRIRQKRASLPLTEKNNIQPLAIKKECPKSQFTISVMKNSQKIVEYNYVHRRWHAMLKIVDFLPVDYFSSRASSASPRRLGPFFIFLSQWQENASLPNA